MLQFTGVVADRDMRAQYLDRMDIERERGITIKAQNVRLPWNVDGTDYVLHLIDTPGHVDFTYEVSRALEACEGAVLLVDAAQGIEAQTLANLYLALDRDLHIIPVLNKIDLPAADPDRYAAEIAHIIGCEPGDVLRVSGKTGDGVADLLDHVVREVPPPQGDADAPTRAMIFDSVYDIYRGVVTYVRVIDGKILPRERIKMMSTGATHELLEVGIVSPDPKAAAGLGVGEVGYLITGVKDVRQSKVGDTVTTARHGATDALTGYREPKPMVYSGLYPVDGSDYPNLRDALDKLQLNDAALTYEPETSVALGFGFRSGFLGLLHMEITRERLEREFDLDLISTSPNVVYRVVKDDGTEIVVTNPSDWPEGKVRTVFEPVVKTTIIAPSEFIGTIMELCQSRRGELGGMDYLSPERVELRYTMPLGEIIFDFFDSLKSRTRGYASLDYEECGRTGSRSGEGRHPPAGRGRRRVQRDRAQGFRGRVREQDDYQAQGAHPAPAVRGSGAGRDRLENHCPREHPSNSQGRAVEMLRRRHHPQAQAAGEAEGRQEADEDHRAGRGTAGGLRRGVVDRRRRRQAEEMTVGARAAGVAVAVAVLVSGCVSTVAGTAVRDGHAVPTDVPPLDESALEKVLIPIDEVNEIMGSTKMEVTGELDEMTDSSDKVSDPDCLGAMFGAEEPVYDGSGWTAVRDLVAREPEDDNDHWVEQTAVLYPQADNAKRFFEKSKSIWEKCAGSSIAVDTEDTSSLWEFGDVTADDGLITQLATQEDADGWGCQHAMAVVSNMTAETWACAYSLSDEAATMALDIVDKAAGK